jgi:hypothetical protein
VVAEEGPPSWEEARAEHRLDLVVRHRQSGKSGVAGSGPSTLLHGGAAAGSKAASSSRSTDAQGWRRCGASRICRGGVQGRRRRERGRAACFRSRPPPHRGSSPWWARAHGGCACAHGARPPRLSWGKGLAGSGRAQCSAAEAPPVGSSPVGWAEVARQEGRGKERERE